MFFLATVAEMHGKLFFDQMIKVYKLAYNNLKMIDGQRAFTYIKCTLGKFL